MGEITIGVWILSVSVLLCLLAEAFVVLPLWGKEHISNG
jgi:hypothetical protein